ncbi:AKND1 protein, partial [Rhinopomastus cyanomelas]|nr:AKND1 protein [Rhinopomastus cyanomelas]
TSFPNYFLTANKMLTHRADDQNQTDHVRLNPKMPPQSGSPNASSAAYSGGRGTPSEAFPSQAPTPVQCTCCLPKTRLLRGPTAAALPAAGTEAARCLSPSDSQPQLTLGEKMSQILRDQTDQLVEKVESFSQHMTQEMFLSQDNYLVNDLTYELKRHLNALERNYLTAKAEHSDLQLHSDKAKSISVGQFDPERKVEGAIFRLGLLLEGTQRQSNDGKPSAAARLTPCSSAPSVASLCE